MDLPFPFPGGFLVTTFELSPYELTLLPKALSFTQGMAASEGGEPTQDQIKRHLHCASETAKNLQHYLRSTKALKVVDRMEAGHERATDKAIIQVASGTSQYSGVEDYFARECARLSRLLAKRKFEEEVESTARHQQVEEELASLKEQGKQAASTPVAIKRQGKPVGNMLEVNIPDAHFGKLAWGVETGGRPYDTKIAEVMYTRAVDALIERSSGYKFDEVVYVIGNDILNSNDAENKTAHGTVVTTDGRYHKTFWKVRSTVVDSIEKLRKVAPVRVITVFGNHDTLSAWHLGDSLECYFHKYDDVTVENSPRYRKYYSFGSVMLLLTHGDKGKREDFPLLMATEEPEMWARTKHREAHTGHNHSTKTQEFHGVRVRILPALCPPDDWHSENSFTGNLRNAEAFIWNKQEGLIGMVTYNDDSQSEIKTKREVVNNVTH
jgi:hypothetical protein